MSNELPVSNVYLVPAPLHENTNHVLPAYIGDAVKECEVFFVENERSARRYLKSIWKEMVIDNYKWFAIHKAEASVKNEFIKCIRSGKNIAIISEAGCPGIADPGQVLIAAAHENGAIVKPLVGPSSILLALMASGMSGQQFQFNGYLPVDSVEKVKTLKQLESESLRKNCTQVFIETPYRNNQLMETMLKTLQPATRLCVASAITSPEESIKTKRITEWKKAVPDLHKKPVIFCLYAPPTSPDS